MDRSRGAHLCDVFLTNAVLAAVMAASTRQASKRANACGAAIVKERNGRSVRLSLPKRLH
jgi:hypothetical protein